MDGELMNSKETLIEQLNDEEAKIQQLNIEQMSITELKNWWTQLEEKEKRQMISLLEKDTRKGVQLIVHQWYKKENDYKQKLKDWQKRSEYEQALWKKGIEYIAGVDEVGRGPLAGPVVAAAVVLPPSFFHIDINDSKQLSAQKRSELAHYIKQEALYYDVCFVDAAVIDQINIYEATKQAMVSAVNKLSVTPDYLLIDAMELDKLSIPQQSLVKGDARSISIAAASILAKHTRDTYMTKMAIKYPQYGFENHKGYGTKEHYEALEAHGVTPLHRKSFLQIKNA